MFRNNIVDCLCNIVVIAWFGGCISRISTDIDGNTDDLGRDNDAHSRAH